MECNSFEWKMMHEKDLSGMCCYDNDKDLPHITLKFHDERVNVHMKTVAVIPLFLYNIYSHTFIHSTNYFLSYVLNPCLIFLFIIFIIFYCTYSYLSQYEITKNYTANELWKNFLAYIHNFSFFFAFISTFSKHQKHYSIFSSDWFTSFSRLSIE